MKTLILTILSIQLLFASGGFVAKETQGKSVTLVKNDFKVLEFNKRIVDILVSDSKKLEVSFIKNKNKPLQTIKLFAKELGYSRLLITFSDRTKALHEINIVQNLSKIIEVIKLINNKVDVLQANGKVILKGVAKDTKEKDRIINLLTQAGINTQQDLINLLEVENPNKMIRIKLYVTEIDNSQGKDIKNNWIISSRNYTEAVGANNTYYNMPLNQMDSVNNQRSQNVNQALDSIVTNAVSLTGGLTGAANYLGEFFNVGLTLNYLSTKGVATVLDETELITLEDKKSVFHAGGKIYIKMQTTTAQGIPTTELKSIDYGLKLEVKVNNIINGEYVDMTITTRQDKINWSEQVEGIPGFSNQSIDTFAIVKNKATVVLGGLVNKNDAKNYWKVPVLGDIPILGELFKSKSFQSGKSELVFFIVPEIVDPSNNIQQKKLNLAKVKSDKLYKEQEKSLYEE